jgi:hypothetical protein
MNFEDMASKYHRKHDSLKATDDGEGKTGLPSEGRSNEKNASVFGGAAAKAANSPSVPETAQRLATTAAHFGRNVLGRDDEEFGEMASKFHRKHISAKAFDVAVQDGTFVSPESKIWPKESKDGLAGTVSAAASTGAHVGSSVAEGNVGAPKPDHSVGKGFVKDGEPLSVEERGHMGGVKGGPARAEILSGAEKEKIARMGGHARWGEGKSERDR